LPTGPLVRIAIARSLGGARRRVVSEFRLSVRPDLRLCDGPLATRSALASAKALPAGSLTRIAIAGNLSTARRCVVSEFRLSVRPDLRLRDGPLAIRGALISAEALPAIRGRNLLLAPDLRIRRLPRGGLSRESGGTICAGALTTS